MPKQRIRQTGGQPYLFDGALLLKADNRRDEKWERKEWHEVAIYRVDVARSFDALGYPHLVKVTFCTVHPRQLPHEWAQLCQFPEAALRDYAPLQYLRGLPAGERYADLAATLAEALERDWLDLLGSVLERWAALPVED